MSIFSLEVLRALKGDCLLLHYGSPEKPKLAIIDGGPAVIYKSQLRPRLEVIRQERGLGDNEALPVDLLMVSHIDDDHIHGILDLTNELVEAADVHRAPFVRISNFWHNTFDSVIGNTPKELLSSISEDRVTASLSGEIGEDGLDPQTAMVLASVDQGFRLRDNAERLNLTNLQLGDKLIVEQEGRPLDMGGGLGFVVAGPMKSELLKLHKQHEAFLEERREKKDAEVPASFTDNSVANLSSIVLLAESEGRSILFTGDARGDKIIAGMEEAGLLEDGKRHVDILKVPHHGSDRNMKTGFFKTITADHYIFSGNGEHGNPERETFEMLIEARGNSDYVVHLTYPVDAIDANRAAEWKNEQEKEKKLAKKAESKGESAKPARENWSRDKHSLEALLDSHPEFAKKISIVEEGKPHTIELEPREATHSAGAAALETGFGADRSFRPATFAAKTLVDLILLGPTGDRRQLQDSPILGDVWLAYGSKPGEALDLLITPEWTWPAGPVARLIARQLHQMRSNRPMDSGDQQDADVAYLHDLIAARLYFHELLAVVVPMTVWWEQSKMAETTKLLASGTPTIAEEGRGEGERSVEILSIPRALRSIIRWSRLMVRGDVDAVDREKKLEKCMQEFGRFTALTRYVSLAGIILWTAEGKPPSGMPGATTGLQRLAYLERPWPIIEILEKLFQEILEKPRSHAEAVEPPLESQPVFQISLNRKASPAVGKSVPAVKGDAARTLFRVCCDKIAWAVLDSGIQSDHPALAESKEKGGKSRVIRAYDFSNIRKIFSLENEFDVKRAERIKLVLGDRINDPKFANADQEFAQLAEDAGNSRPIDWKIAEKYIELPRDTPPLGNHGTHVAGIIGAQEVNEESAGMCPDIKLYDFRVLSDTVHNTEFAIIAALQFIRYLNTSQGFTRIHGANLSLSIPHDVRNFACGRTPICAECTRLVDSGVVVVAAAGNLGYHSFETKDGSYDGYTAFSITDPGNADDVITVGATHRSWPHTFGVSFFSSRGPTGDGRIKPDIVAPGEKIRSCLAGDKWGELDGTSMAAPHVSGAAAMLMARYAELIGQPRKLKKILCETATDLARERTFQGHGMLDVLRAFQKI